MKLSLKRNNLLEKCTIGILLVDGKDMGFFTLEDPIRDVKIPGDTAIPYGTYKVIIDYSKHFNRDLPLLLDVPNFEGVRIHSGNTDLDTEGCILVGKEWCKGDFIGKSREAFDELFDLIKDANELKLEIS